MRLTIEQKNQEEYILKKLNECLRLYKSYERCWEKHLEYEANLKTKLKNELNKDLWFVAYILIQTCDLAMVTWVKYELYSNRYTCNEWEYINIDYIFKDLDSIIKLFEEYIKPWNPSIKDSIELQIISEKVLALLQWKINKENLPKHIIRTLEDINELITWLWIKLKN